MATKSSLRDWTILNGDAEASEVEYEIRPGTFKELCRKARQAPDQRFAMVIDEINRGNISKIFGGTDHTD